MRRCFCIIAALAAVALSGCATTERGSWGGNAHWPSAAEFGRAAVGAARDPMTWVPLAGAAALGITGLDDELSEWAVDHQPVFGSNAGDASDTLRDLSTIAYAATAVLAPEPDIEHKIKGLAVGISAIALTEAITNGTKSVTKRERPNGRDNASFHSGHASASAVRATLAAQNVDYLPLPGWASTSLKIGFYGIATGTAWARVEAEEHYVTDVLVGFAVGHFIARFMHQAFLEAGNTAVSVRFTPEPGGGALTLQYALGGAR